MFTKFLTALRTAASAISKFAKFILRREKTDEIRTMLEIIKNQAGKTNGLINYEGYYFLEKKEALKWLKIAHQLGLNTIFVDEQRFYTIIVSTDDIASLMCNGAKIADEITAKRIKKEQEENNKGGCND